MLTLALVGFSAAATYAQGTIAFANSFLSKLKIIDAPGAAAADAPIGTVVGVFYGPNLAQQTDGVRMAAAGIWNGGAVYALPNAAPGEATTLYIAAWLDKANIAGTPLRVDPTTKEGITHYGKSETVTTTILGPPAGPGTVIWQASTATSVNRAKPFNIELVPEPSVIALGALGLGALLLRRRKA